MESTAVQTLKLTQAEAAEAERIVQSVADVPLTELRITVQDSRGKDVRMPPAMVEFLHAALHAAASGRPVAVATVPEELTSVEAAKALRVSRPTLLKMARNGEIPSHRVGTHTRFFSRDIEELARRRSARSVEAFNDFRDAEDALLNGRG